MKTHLSVMQMFMAVLLTQLFLCREAASQSTCGTDTIVYPYLKELTFTAPNDSFQIDAMVGNVRSASQAYYLSHPIQIKGVQFWGGAYSTSTAPQTLSVRAYLYSVDAQNKPVAALDSTTITVTQEYNFYEGLFATPYTYGSNFAVVVKSIPNDTLAVITNNSGNVWSTNYGENLAWRRFGSGTWNSSLSFFGQDLEYMIFPIVEYAQQEVDFTNTAAGCEDSLITFTNTSSELFSDRMINLIAFESYWQNGADTIFRWNFGDGSEAEFGTNAVHTYASPGTYTVTLTGTIVGYYTSCSSSVSRQITIAPSLAIQSQPANAYVCPDSSAQFTITAHGQNLAYQWQEQISGTFTDITNSSVYSGAEAATLMVNDNHSITNATYRVVLSGGCGNDQISDEVTLTAEDTTRPVFIVCQDDTTIAVANFEYDEPTATDGCGGTIIIARTAGPASNSTFPEGETTVTHTATDAYGNTATCSFKVTYNDATSVRSNAAGTLNGMYPNPASGKVNISLDSEFASGIIVEVTTLAGTIVQEQRFDAANSIELDIADLEKGVYFVNVYSGERKRTGKLVVN